MKQRRPITRLLSVAFSFVAIAAWLSASNHCVVAGLLPAPGAASPGHEHCPAPDAPADSEKSGDCDGMKCCKSLSAPTASAAKNLAAGDTASLTAQNYPGNDCAVSRAQHHGPISELDTGPPHRDSFAESVLQRSLLAHAPPIYE